MQRQKGPRGPLRIRGSRVTKTNEDRSLEQRRVRMMVNKAKDKDLDDPTFKECDPTSESERLEQFLKEDVQMALIQGAMLAELDGMDYSYITGIVDKSRQTVLNKLFGEKEGEGGDSCMELYWNLLKNTTKLIGGINGSERVSSHIANVGPRSDEATFSIGGVQLSEDTGVQFGESWDAAAEDEDYSKYKFTLRMNYQGQEHVFDLDLDSASRVLRYPKMIATCDYKITQPILLKSDVEGHFLMERVRELENNEVEVYDELPKSIKGNGGLAEVETPFKTNLVGDGTTQTRSGTIVEIRFGLPDDVETGRMLELTKDVRDPRTKEVLRKGTKKGFAEIFKREGGMRFQNTFLGKARANKVLTGVAQAMGDLRGKGIAIMPVTGGYLQYWLEAPPGEDTAEMVQEAVSARLDGPRPATLLGRLWRKVRDWTMRVLNISRMEFTPKVSYIDANGMDLSRVRERFILKSLGKDYPAEALGRSDFLINFLEHIAPQVRQGIFDRMALKKNGGKPVTTDELDSLKMIRRVCSMRNAIRDTEDFIWTLRKDNELPYDNNTREELEKFFWRFSFERYETMFYLLATRIKEEAERYY